MKKNTMVKLIKNAKILIVLIGAELLKLYYINKVDKLSRKITDRINMKYIDGIFTSSLEELNKRFPDKEVTKI